MNKVQLLGVMVHPVTLPQAVEHIEQWLRSDSGTCRYVVTPNLDHAVLLKERHDLRDAYLSAALVIADGMPMVWASRLTGSGVKERVAGSDLVPALLGRPSRERKLRVFLLGAAPGVADRAADNIHQRYPNVRVAGTCAPELGFEHRDGENAAIVERINEAEIDLLVVGLGAPKQELWIHRNAPALRARAAICAGATIDFLAGHRQRAPRWMQRTGTEWLYRALSEPRRLIPRYAKDAYHLPGLLLHDWKASRQ
jgi:N-acetylglucosaminyldiphosphoundecaprenol N-acetyl-beta-D-mannosaminyltransferase